MGKAVYSTALVKGELRIEVLPRMRDSWHGTAAQLTEEGVIPDAFEWPIRTARKYFTHLSIACSLQRRRGARGEGWADVDAWILCRQRAGGAKRVLEERSQSALANLLKRSPEEMRIFDLFSIARQDAQFQEFKQRTLGVG